MVETFFVEKNPTTFGRFFFSGPKNFDFWSKKNSLKKSMKIQNFEISKIFRKIFDKKSKNFGPKIVFDQKFSDFFRRNNFRPEMFGLRIPIPSVSKIPKIALRKLCDEAWRLPGTE